MLYGVVRFWILWGGAFHGLNLLRKNDSRSPTFWQQQNTKQSKITAFFRT
jgi:hypothetical protein